MRSYRKELWFEIPTRRAFINITSQVEDCLRESGIREGLVLVNAMHITASVFINDDEGGLHQDYEDWLEGLAPHEPINRYRHNRTGEDNGDAHLKNFGILYEEGMQNRFLAPAYDVVNTLIYLEKDKPALTMFGKKVWFNKERFYAAMHTLASDPNHARALVP